MTARKTIILVTILILEIAATAVFMQRSDFRAYSKTTPTKTPEGKDRCFMAHTDPLGQKNTIRLAKQSLLCQKPQPKNQPAVLGASTAQNDSGVSGSTETKQTDDHWQQTPPSFVSPPVTPKPVIRPAKPKASRAPMPYIYEVKNGKRVCNKKHDKPSMSEKYDKKHMDMECCLDPDEYPNPNCYYPPEKYGKYLH